jgi:Fe-Mn family superoxide dismutase
MAFELPPLPYDYEALQPSCRRRRWSITTTSTTRPMSTTATSWLPKPAWTGNCRSRRVVKQSFGKNAGLFNNAGQHYNHIHFWKWMKKGGGGNKLPGKLQKAVDSDLGGYDKFKADFIAAGTTQFGSGWAWLSVKNGKLEISKTPNGENPLVHGASPILGVDVWEHSYYIDYRNARPKYLEAFVDSLINWDYVLEMYDSA